MRRVDPLGYARAGRIHQTLRAKNKAAARIRQRYRNMGIPPVPEVAVIGRDAATHGTCPCRMCTYKGPDHKGERHRIKQMLHKETLAIDAALHAELEEAKRLIASAGLDMWGLNVGPLLDEHSEWEELQASDYERYGPYTGWVDRLADANAGYVWEHVVHRKRSILDLAKGVPVQEQEIWNLCWFDNDGGILLMSVHWLHDRWLVRDMLCLCREDAKEEEALVLPVEMTLDQVQKYCVTLSRMTQPIDDRWRWR